LAAKYDVLTSGIGIQSSVLGAGAFSAALDNYPYRPVSTTIHIGQKVKMKNTNTKKTLRLTSCAVGTTLCALSMAWQPARAQVYAYPLKNQSAQQQQRDEAECAEWATQRTGFNPLRPPAYSGHGYAARAPAGQSGVFGRGDYGQGGGVADAAKGAGLGAVGGAIAGNAGKGAAIGALSGLFIGGVKRSSQQAERAAWYRQQQQQEAQARAQYERQLASMQAEFDRAFSACLDARGYRVR
jgi:hypothetical protein